MDYLPVYEHNRSPSLFSLSCDSARFSPHIHPDEAGAVKHDCASNKRRNTITCKDEGVEEDVADVGSLNMGDIHVSGTSLTPERYIPVIPKRFFTLSPDKVKQGVVGITLEDIFVSKPLWLRDGKYRVSGNIEVNTQVLRYPVFRGKKVILLFSARDRLLEHLWWDRNDFHLFEKLAEIGFYAVTTPNFSIFAGECPVGHALNIKKGLVCAKECEDNGLVVIPHIYAVNEHQLSRWVAWLKKNPGVKTIAMNCQIQRKSSVGRDIAVRALLYLLNHTDTNIILQGGDKRIHAELRSFEKRLHIASSGVFKRMEMEKTMHVFPYSILAKVAEMS